MNFSWKEKFIDLKLEEQIFLGWYIRNNGKRISSHSVKISSLLKDAKKRSKQKRVEFSITREDITIPRSCPLLGIPIICGKGLTVGNSPTIDEIFPNRGYTSKNIQIISHKANRMKNNCLSADLKKIYEGYKALISTK